MKKLALIQIIISLLLILLILYTGCDLYNVSSPSRGSGGSSNSSIWTTQLLGASGASTHAEGITLDPSGNIYVTGYTYGNLDGQTLTGICDMFVVKYDANGVKQWITQLLGVDGAYTIPDGITLDTSGNIYVAGVTDGDLGGQTLTGICDTFVVKYNQNGVKQWITQLLGVDEARTSANGITLDPSGNIYVTGVTDGDLGGQTLTGIRDLFVVKYDANGVKQWITQLLGVEEASTYAEGITLDPSGNIYVTGDTEGNLDGQSLTGDRDMFVVKYNQNGVKQWITQLLGVEEASTYAEGITLDPSGNIYVTGHTYGNLDGQTITGICDTFVVKYNQNGVKQWITQLLGASGGYTVPGGITLDTSGNIYITGSTSGNLDLHPLTGIYDLFIVKYDVNGNKQWSRLLGAYGADTIVYGITLDSSSNSYITGSTTGNLDGKIKTGDADLFIVKYNANGDKQ